MLPFEVFLLSHCRPSHAFARPLVYNATKSHCLGRGDKKKNVIHTGRDATQICSISAFSLLTLTIVFPSTSSVTDTIPFRQTFSLLPSRSTTALKKCEKMTFQNQGCHLRKFCFSARCQFYHFQDSSTPCASFIF